MNKLKIFLSGGIGTLLGVCGCWVYLKAKEIGSKEAEYLDTTPMLVLNWPDANDAEQFKNRLMARYWSSNKLTFEDFIYNLRRMLICCGVDAKTIPQTDILTYIEGWTDGCLEWNETNPLDIYIDKSPTGKAGRTYISLPTFDKVPNF